MKRSIRALALAAAVVLLLAACDSGDDSAGDETPTDETSSEERDSDADETPDDGADAGGATVQTAETDLGAVLADGDGMTLYAFANDDPGVSNCTEGCASTWPPLEAGEDFVVGAGLDATLFSTIERNDGSLQLAVSGMPLYTYAADSAPGDTNGHGVGDVWFAVNADGTLVEDGGSASSGGLGY